jgi:hypothetical protein
MEVIVRHQDRGALGLDHLPTLRVRFSPSNAD